MNNHSKIQSYLSVGSILFWIDMLCWESGELYAVKFSLLMIATTTLNNYYKCFM